ncbi:MAG TPA: chromosomal replication initiator protein DnaA [Acidimicrobiia bacterium]
MDATNVAGAEELWARVSAAVRQQLSESTWEVWFQGIRAIDLSDERLTIAVANPMARDRILAMYRSVLDDACNALTGTGTTIHVVMDPNDVDDALVIDLTQSAPTASAGVTTERVESRPESEPTVHEGLPGRNPGVLNPRYTFDQFVIGTSNRFAAAAALAVAEEPARSYNPLFIYGPAGLGKTHLLHAIGHHVRQLFTTKRVRYVSTETMMNDFIDAMRSKSNLAFKRRYRDVDVLLIDDIQFLERTEQLQEEFFHTFNDLHGSGGQIVISSDRPPKSIAKIEDRLRSRFEWGLITDIQPPEFETRLAILQKKAEAEHLDGLPSDVLGFIAEHITDNVRELEGSLHRIAAYSSLHRVPLNIDMTRKVLCDLIPARQPRVITPALILDVTAQMFGHSVEELTGPSRRRPLVTARQIGMYVFRQLTEYSYPKIAEEFGGRDHTTVMHACDKIKRQMSEKQLVFDQVNELIAQVKQAAGG